MPRRTDATDEGKEDTDTTGEKEEVTDITPADGGEATDATEEEKEDADASSEKDETTDVKTPANVTEIPTGAAGSLMSWNAVGLVALFGMAAAVWSLLG